MEVKYIEVDSTVSPKETSPNGRGRTALEPGEKDVDTSHMVFRILPREEWVVVAAVLLARLWPVGIHKTRNIELFKY